MKQDPRQTEEVSSETSGEMQTVNSSPSLIEGQEDIQRDAPFVSGQGRKGKFKLSYKIVLIFVLVMVIPMILSTVLVREDVTRRSDLERLRSLKQAAEIARKYVTSNCDSYLIQATRLSENQEFRSLLKEGESDQIDEFLALEMRRRNLDMIQVLNLERNTISMATSGGFMSGYKPSEDLLMNGVRKIPDTRIVISGNDSDDRFECLIESCIHVEQYGQELRLLVFVKRLPADFFDQLKDLTNLNITVLKGTLRVLTTIFDSDGKRVVGTTVDQAIAELVSKAGLAVQWEKFLGEKFYTIYEPLEPGESRKEVLISAAIDETTFLETNFILINYLTVITVVAILLAVLAGVFLSYNIVTPLKKLVAGARAVGQGELGITIDVDVNDEIGVLSDEFNGMAANLKHSYDRLDRKMYEISTLYSVSNSINFQSDSEQILNVILDKTVAALHAERGSLMLLNDDTDELEVRVVRGFKGEVKKRIGLKSGEGIAGIVYKQGSGVMVNKGHRDDRFKTFQNYIEDIKNIQSMICVPLKVKDRTLGVLNIVNRVSHGDMFSEDDLNLATALATHAAMAIENAKLYELSITDGMTKLFIHRFFQIRLSEELVRARRYSSKLSLIMFDIDHFKNFNDTYGHQTGDDVLVGVAGILKKAVRQEVDVPARYGGEEFTVIAPETDGDEAMIVAERIRKAVEAAEFPGPEGKVLKVKVSLGVSVFPTHSTEKMDLIRKADTALYFSKENGRNCSTLYSENMGEVSEK